MRRTALLLILLCTLPALVAAQQSGDRATAEHKDVGRLSVRTQIYSQAVGVVSELVRSSFAQTVECNAVCYFPNDSNPIAWKCAPKKTCRLHCTTNPPTGGC